MHTTRHNVKTRIKANITICSSTYCEEVEAETYLHFRGERIIHIDVENPKLEEIIGRKGGGYYKLIMDRGILIVDLSKLSPGLQLLMEIEGLSKQDVIIETRCYIRGKKGGLFIGIHDKHLLRLLESLRCRGRH